MIAVGPFRLILNAHSSVEAFRLLDNTLKPSVQNLGFTPFSTPVQVLDAAYLVVGTLCTFIGAAGYYMYGNGALDVITFNLPKVTACLVTNTHSSSSWPGGQLLLTPSIQEEPSTLCSFFVDVLSTPGRAFLASIAEFSSRESHWDFGGFCSVLLSTPAQQ